MSRTTIPGRGASSKAAALEASPEVAEAFGVLIDAMLTAVRSEFAARAKDDGADPLLRSDRLGPNNRIVLGLIKRGALRGVRIAGRWHVRRSEWDRYVGELEHAQRTTVAARAANDAAPAPDVPQADADAVLAELGFERRAAGRGRRRR